MIDNNRKINSDTVAEFNRYFQPNSYVVTKLPNEKTVRDFTEVYKKNETGAYDTYRMIKGKWVLTNNNLHTVEQVITSGGGGGSATDYSGNIQANADAIAANEASISTNASDISTNASNIQANADAIALNKTVVKNTDETKNSDTTLADDSELVVALEANSKYLIDILVGFYFDATPDIKIQLAFGGTLTSWLANNIICENDGSATFTNIFNDTVLTTTHTITSAVNTNGILRIKGIIEVGTTGGDLSIQWAQNTSDAGNTTVKKGSFIKTYKI